jgi:hypothetical protein
LADQLTNGKIKSKEVKNQSTLGIRSGRNAKNELHQGVLDEPHAVTER